MVVSGGSSPLARGLLDREMRRPEDQGIIPARAGFTSSAAGRGRAARDHPRSRGVYGAQDPQDRYGPGSSPLARGLPLTTIISTLMKGIIPARAGFT